MAETEDEERAKRLAGRFAEEETETNDTGGTGTKVLSMKIPEPLYERVGKKFEEVFVAYVKETEKADLKKQDFYEALITVGIDNLNLKDVK